ncbi:2-phospho-L-lactate guanylyltransferase [Curtobacterium sp. MCBD17_003]|uniref:2-phospho-L-lactate guanylyltransferase n=1 Tax=Curtobacterium sp. MCBD17_003 TaxID=2175667 RepID=UPI000DAA51AB|nr:2-phospho-L-lactate guanylyltransferase [Curtobacterium sp. MCBD17_003]WIE53520.1 2-phospho-L-lactate guanylyltransferase [Curtobacterium sp. MCBD17_003]
MTPDWTIVVPVKGTAGAKTRLAATPEQALAIALDTVAVAATVAPVVVVTHPSSAPAFHALAVTVVEDPGRGLDAAVLAGITTCAHGPTAVLQGDLPALDAAQLRAALAAAAAYPRAVLPDADGTGTVLLTALHGHDHRPRFGRGSARAHRAQGYTELDLPGLTGLRRDVDTPAHLAALGSGLGPRTLAAFARS